MKDIKHKILFLLPILLIIITSCETDITLSLPQGEEKLVVEGYIEPGLPPFIIISKSLAYFAPTSIATIANSFVHDAVVKISDGTKTDSLQEINLSMMSDTVMKRKILDYFQMKSGSIAIELYFSIYTTNYQNPNSIVGEVGKTYSLSINAQGKTLSAVTTIPLLIVPDSFWVMPPKGQPENDTMVKLFFRFQEPGDQINNYRYFTKTNSEPFYTDRFGSVMDDKLINGQYITWNLGRGTSESDTIDRKTRGLFHKGDTVVIKFCTIDDVHREFWQTFELAGYGGGFFSNPTRIKTNIIGGLGIWGGYGASYHTFIIPK